MTFEQLTLVDVPPTPCSECLLPLEDGVQVRIAGFDAVVWICREHWHDFPGDFVRAG